MFPFRPKRSQNLPKKPDMSTLLKLNLPGCDYREDRQEHTPTQPHTNKQKRVLLDSTRGLLPNPLHVYLEIHLLVTHVAYSQENRHHIEALVSPASRFPQPDLSRKPRSLQTTLLSHWNREAWGVSDHGGGPQSP